MSLFGKPVSTFPGHALAADTLLFPLDALTHAERRPRIFAQHLAERGASRFLLAERGERGAESQQRVGSLGGRFVFGRDVEKGLGGIAVALALEQAFAEPVFGLRRHPVARILAQEGAETFLRLRIVLALDVAVSEVVIVARAVRWRQGRDLRSGGRRAGIGGRRPTGRERGFAVQSMNVEWLAPHATAGGRRLLGDFRRRAAARDGPQRPRRTGCGRILRRIERVGAATGRLRGWWCRSRHPGAGRDRSNVRAERARRTRRIGI